MWTRTSQTTLRDPEIDLDLGPSADLAGCLDVGRLGAGDDLAGAHDGQTDEVQVHSLRRWPVLTVRPHRNAAHFRYTVAGTLGVVTLGTSRVAVETNIKSKLTISDSSKYKIKNYGQ